MKKLSFMIVAAGLLATSAFAAKEVTVTKTNGGKAGYATVTEKHTESLFTETHSLNCTDPGSTACSWVTQPMVGNPNGGNAQVEVIQLMVDAQIDAGNTQGSGSLNGANYTWSGLNSCNYTLQINCP